MSVTGIDASATMPEMSTARNSFQPEKAREDEDTKRNLLGARECNA